MDQPIIDNAPNPDVPEEQPGFLKKSLRLVLGAPKSFRDPRIFHKIALIPVLAWIGLGADGLSSSSYGPEEAFRALGSHIYMTVFLGLATTLTVFIISYAYSRIIEHFPHGGGGYVVATNMLGKRAGVISGSALIHDYILTISISIASCVDAIFSFLPLQFQGYKLILCVILILLLIVMNIRGVKESTLILAPIFIVFVITHIFLIVYGLGSHAERIIPLSHEVYSNFQYDLTTIGAMSMLLLFLRAYSLGGGTYRHRGRIERASDNEGAEGPDGQEDHGVHGHVPCLYRDGTFRMLSSFQGISGRGQNP